MNPNALKVRNIRRRNVGNIYQNSGYDDGSDFDINTFFAPSSEDDTVSYMELSDAATSNATEYTKFQVDGRKSDLGEQEQDGNVEESNRHRKLKARAFSNNNGGTESIPLSVLGPSSASHEQEESSDEGEDVEDRMPSLTAGVPSLKLRMPTNLKALLKLKTPVIKDGEDAEARPSYPESPSPPPPTPEMSGRKGHPKLSRMQSRGVIVVGLQKHMRRDSFQEDVGKKMRALTIDRQQSEVEVLMDRLIADHNTKEQALLYVVKEVFPESKVQKLVVALLQRGATPTEVDSDGRSSVFHAVNRNFTQVLRKLLEAKAAPHKKDKLGETPIQKAIMERRDDMAALLIAYMPNAAVRRHFSSHGRRAAKASFHKLLQSGMQLTILGVLDCLIDPTPSCTFKVNYQLLECDETGRSPKSTSYTKSSKSALHLIAFTKNKDAISHNAVRLLLKRKWQMFARSRFIFNAVSFLISLLIMTFALVVAAASSDVLKYNSAIHYARALAEVYSVIFVFGNLILEFIQMYRNRLDYWKDPFNWLDLFSITLLLAVVPLRFTATKQSWPVFGVGYFLWSMRTFKYASVTRSTGAFSQILWRILSRDILQFVAVFLVVLLSFSGLLLAGLAYEGILHNSQKLPWETKSFWTTLLSGTRTLVEQQPVVEYVGENGLGPFSVTVMLAFLFTTLVVLLNILIARLSDTYQNVQKEAQSGLELDRAWLIMQQERDAFPRDVRKKYYMEEETIDDVQQELEKWETPVVSNRTQMLVDIQDQLGQQDLYMLNLSQRQHNGLRVSHRIQARLADVEKKLNKLLPQDERDSAAWGTNQDAHFPSLGETISLGSPPYHQVSGPSSQDVLALVTEMTQIRRLVEDIKQQKQK